MARITIEDCMEQVPNRFMLVRMASIRAKQLKKGARPLLETVDNKEIVTSLREIAKGVVKPCDTSLVPENKFDAAAVEAAPVVVESFDAPAVEATPVAADAPDAFAGAGEIAAEEPTPEG
jgi:DNA-directed RNA polymerase subunit omega